MQRISGKFHLVYQVKVLGVKLKVTVLPSQGNLHFIYLLSALVKDDGGGGFQRDSQADC